MQSNEMSTHLNHAKLFGAAVRRERLTVRGISQEQLAHDAGLDRSYVGQVERGERNLSLDKIIRLAYALEVPVAVLFKEIDEDAARLRRQPD